MALAHAALFAAAACLAQAPRAGSALKAPAGRVAASGLAAGPVTAARLDGAFDNAAFRPSLALTPAPSLGRDSALAGRPALAAAAPIPAPLAGRARSTPAALAAGPLSAAAEVPPPAPGAPAPEPAGAGSWRAAVPNGITALNLLSGLAAIAASASGAATLAGGLILLAAVFDALDGRAARALGVASPLGVQLDSLADVVSFGAAPALLLWTAALGPLGAWGFAAAGAFALAGAYRLARFNLGAAKPRPALSDSFTGMPIPAGAAVAVAAVGALPLLPAAWAPAAAAGAALVAAAAMVSRLPYPAFKAGGLRALELPALAAAAAALPLWAAGLGALVPAALAALYLPTGPLRALWHGGSPAFRRELKRKAFHQLLLGYLAAYFVLGPELSLWAMGGWTALVGALETARLRLPWARRVAERSFGGIIREKEAGRYSGAFYAALGLFATVALHGASPALVAAGVLGLVWGDAASPLVGLRFGWKPYTVRGTKRSLDGTLAGFAVALGIGFMLGFPPAAALGAALVFTAVDAYPVKPDDNLWIPVAFSTALAALSALL